MPDTCLSSSPTGGQLLPAAHFYASGEFERVQERLNIVFKNSVYGLMVIGTGASVARGPSTG